MPRAGNAAPPFTSVTESDASIQLSDYRGHWVVLFFYPKDDTPG